MSILLPLYIYPWPGVWDALYWEAQKNPKLNFTVILNPCSGPCLASLPPQVYIDEIPRLKQWDNIRTLGYVATNYTEKEYSLVAEEIRQYALWPTIMNDSRLAVDGIFFDETPGAYHWQKHAYLKDAADAVRSYVELGDQVVVHNPGTLPDAVWNYLDIANITVILEDTFAHFIDGTRFNLLKNFSKVTGLPKSAFSIMLHSLGNIPNELVQWTAEELKEIAGWNFATSTSEAGEYWHSFSSILDTFITRYAEV